MSAAGAGTVGGSDRLRLFTGLPIPDEAASRLLEWANGAFGAPGIRPVARGNLHVTLAFLGAQPADRVGEIAVALGAAAATIDRPPTLTPRLYRETRSVGMLVLDDEDERATRVADELASHLETLGVFRRERRAWLPHLTVIRFRQPPGLRPPLPDLGAFSPSEAALYHSVLRPSGAQYQIVESVALGG